MEYLFLIILAIGICIYLTDRKGWNATAKRLSTIVRAHIESAKPVKQISKKIEQQELDSWTAEFNGTSSANEPNHVIIKTWFAMYGGELLPHFKCKCGYANWGISISSATRDSNKHVREQNEADELLEENGGTHAW